MDLNFNEYPGRALGMPPKTHISDSMIINSMPIAEITPAIPTAELGYNYYSLDTAQGAQKYIDMVSATGYSSSNVPPLRVAFLADNFPSDSFVNDYGETFLQKSTDVVSRGVAEIMQVTGSDSLTQGIDKISGLIGGAGEGIKGPIGTAMQGIAGAGKSAASAGKQIQANLEASASQGNRFLAGAANTINKVLGGQRVDFPQIWRNSGFTPSYTMTIRLYNPKPGSLKYTERYIIGPLAFLLCLAIPRSSDGKFYNWPLFHKVRAAGIYNLDPAVITNITVIKGGDQQQFAFTQRMAMVDVRLDFASLFSTMLAEEGRVTSSNRPTVRKYLEALKSEGKEFYRRNSMRADASRSSSPTLLPGSNTQTTSSVQSGSVAIGQSGGLSSNTGMIQLNQDVKNLKKAEIPPPATDISRINATKKSVEDNLADQSPVTDTDRLLVEGSRLLG